MTLPRTLKTWGTCLDCGYQGMLEYSEIVGEDYDDPHALGVMLLLRCPACESRDNALVAIDYYRELTATGTCG